MRHGKKFNHLGRKKASRDALLKNLAISLIEHKRINTTLAKAKALRLYVEPLITKSKNNTTHNRRVVFSYLQNKEAIIELFDTIAVRVADRPGGYVRVLHTGFRKGDNAEMGMIELVDFNELRLEAGSDDQKGGRRRRRKKKSGASEGETTAPVAQPVAAATEESAPAEESTTEENKDGE
jgi:large subunit ribosomal protein L17